MAKIKKIIPYKLGKFNPSFSYVILFILFSAVLLLLYHLLPIHIINAAVIPPNAKVCQDKGAVRTIYYDVAAFEVEGLPLNGWGEHFHKANIYALNNPQAHPNKQDILSNTSQAALLVLRANVGDCIIVRFKNDIPQKRVGMTIAGLTYDPNISDGLRVGKNTDTTVATSEERTFVWYADHEGQFPINDLANTNPSNDEDTMRIGLYGGFIVEPKDSVWRNPINGENLLKDIDGNLTGINTPVFADIEVPGGNVSSPNDFRDYALIFMDENEEIHDVSDTHPTMPSTGFEDSTFGFNYRSEPLRNRLRAILDHRAGKEVILPNGKIIKPQDHFCDGYDEELGAIPSDPSAKCMGEESHLQSWPFGDPGKITRKNQDGTISVESDNLIPKAYVGDPVRFRIIHPGQKEQHSFHQHQHRWFHEPDDPNSTRLDVQLTGPGQTFELRFEKGAGSGPGVPGDAVFHCHLYPHFAQGFWGIFRTFDKLRNAEFNQTYPDGTPLETLQELPDRKGLTPPPSEQKPGFPLFIKGQILQKGYKPPNFVVDDPYKQNAAGKILRRPGDTIREPNALERANMAGNNGKPGNDKTPGVFSADPCPLGANERLYEPVAVDTDPDNPVFKFLQYNEKGNGTGQWKDPDGRLYVEKSHLDSLLSGKEKPEPYTVRVKMGECAKIRFTNKLYVDDLNRPENQNQEVPVDVHGDGEVDHFGEQVFHAVNPMSEVSVHTHLFMYDTLASDGTSIGWNYDMSALAAQTIESRFYVDLNLRTVFFHDHQFPNTGQQHGLYAVWNVEPPDSSWEKLNGSASDGVGTSANIIVPNGKSFREFTLFYSDFSPAFRMAPDLPGNQGKLLNDIIPIFPRGMQGPEDHGADQGTMLINYRNEPFQIRTNPLLPSSDTRKNDPAYLFSSAIHGDPATPILKAYRKDPIIIRHIQGAHEEQHNFNINGHRWLHEPDDPNSNIYDAQSLNIAEFFNYDISGNQITKNLSGPERAREIASQVFGSTKVLLGGAGSPGDYFYGSLPIDDLWSGMWGIMRVYNKQVSDLKPLPNNAPANNLSEWPALKPGEALKKAPGPGDPCIPGAPKRLYKVGVLGKKIIYNKEGDNDPNGLTYTLLDAFGRPQVSDKPLFIRANEGECVEITLKNMLPTSGIPAHKGDTHPPEDIFPKRSGVICNKAFGADACGVEEEEVADDANMRWLPSKRVSLHPHLLKYDVTGSDGATVGYNFDQTVAPGESITYRYFADSKNLGIANLSDFGDIRGHRHHGLFGGITIEPKGAVHLNPANGLMLASGDSSVIRYVDSSGAKGFREFVVALQDGINLYDKLGIPIPDLKEHPGDLQNSNTPRKVDPEDQGHKGINYKAERFANRLLKNPQEAWVFSSDPAVGHGDPATPVFESYPKEPVTFRVFDPQDKPRGLAFNLHEHFWRHESNDPNSTLINTQAGIDTGRAFNLELVGGAGGISSAPGDYLYKCTVYFNCLNDGVWGIFRVHPQKQSNLKPLQEIIGTTSP